MKILTDPRSGSYQGITSSRNRYGQYVRTRAIPVQPRTPKQGVVRGVFGAAATVWRGISDENRAAWANMAANYSVSDSLGQSNPLNGFSFFQSAQLGEYAANGFSWGAGAPTDLASFSMDPGGYAIIADASASTVLITLNPSPIPADHNVIIQSTGPVSPGITSPPGPHPWRQVASLAPAAVTGVDIGPSYEALFGNIVADQRIFFRLREWDDNAGRASSWTTVSVIAVA